MKFSNYKKSNIHKKVIACVTSFVLAVTSLPLADVSKSIGSVVSKFVNMIQAEAAYSASIKDDIFDNVYTVTNDETLVKLFNSDPAEYDKITIKFANISPISQNALAGVTNGLGSEDHPFKGKLETADQSFVNLYTTVALFDYLDDSAELCNITLHRTEDNSNALLAEYVTHKTDLENAIGWNVTNATVSGATGNTFMSFAGVIGEMQENSKVNVTFVNKADRVSRGGSASNDGGDVGLICNNMRKNTQLTVSLNTAPYDVTSTSSYAAGGLVGSMEKGSKLTVTGEYTNNSGVITGRQAGGLVGYAVDAIISLDSGTKPVFGGQLNGSDSAGGIVGTYYANSGNDFINSIDLVDWSEISPTITSTGGSAGGLFGKIYNNGSLLSINVNGNENSSFNVIYDAQQRVTVGGIAGLYNASDQTSEIVVSNAVINIQKNDKMIGDFGGLFGSVQGESNYFSKGAYIKSQGCKITVSALSSGNMKFNACVGGVAGWIHSGFFDISDITVVMNGFQADGNNVGGAGLLGYIDDRNVNSSQSGVLRLSGDIDLSGVYPNESSANKCQIVGVRNNALVYATAECTIARNNSSSVDMDDLGQWGQVIMLDDEDLTEAKNGVLYFDEKAHKVSIVAGDFSSSGVTITNERDFASAALIAQIDTNSYVNIIDSNGIISSFTRTDLLKSNITISNDIDMTGTGVTGLMRDNGDGNSFTGSINGGTNKSNVTLSDNSVCYHTHLGLFAKTSVATISNLTIKGDINAKAYKDDTFIGGVTANNAGTLTVENVNSNINVEFGSDADLWTYAGGYVGYTDGVGDINFTNCAGSAKISFVGKPNNKEKYSCFYIGGFMGLSASTAGREINFTDCKVSGEIKNTKDSYNVNIGGLIGELFADTKQTGYHKVTLKNVTIDGLKITANAGLLKIYDKTSYNGNSGGLLGHGWYRSNVYFGDSSTNGLTVKNSTLTVNGSEAYMGGLVYAASGYWQVNQINLTNNTFSGKDSRFGMLVNKMCRVDDKDDNVLYSNSENDALYLEVHDGAYDLSDNTLDLGTPVVFDEFAAYSTNDGGAGSSGQGVISIPAKIGNDYKVYMDGENCNTYQNRTDIKQTNPNTRYYYNLDVMEKSSSKTNTENFMLWSVKQYAANNLQSYFTGTMPTNATIDLEGYSYYPVSITNGATVSGNTFVFHNKEIEASERVDDGDNVARYTNGSDSEHTQHYLMHHGLFCNVSSSVVLNNITLSGNIGSTAAGSGAIICGTAAGSSNSSITVKLDGITLKDLYVNNEQKIDVYPLIINQGGTNLALTVSGVKNTANYNMGGNYYAATSLIGNVTGTGISVGFSSIKLDARRSNVLADLDSIYGTTKSLFKNATLMQRFQYSGTSSSGSYNYTFDEDWEASGTNYTHKGDVTYGYEVSNSVKNPKQQNKYYHSDIYTNPEKANADSEYDFLTDFLPYVAKSTATGESEDYHEIDVNIYLPILDKGCGTYSDPYIIDDAEQLKAVAKAINGGASVGWAVNYNKDKDFCDGLNKHELYTVNGSNFVSSSGQNVSMTDMRTYLCEAYYQIDEDLTLDSDFSGLGGLTEDYGFRGVIYGSDHTITNESVNPLIKNSNGSVVKDLTVKVSAAVSLRGSSSDISNYKFDFSDNTEYCPAYGAVMGKVFGGDNIMDNVSVDFENALTVNGAQGYLVPVGGYIGVVVYGGVYFRNMNGKNGLTESNLTGINDKSKLYQNPYIGRVVNGFAVEEGISFGESSLNNGKKNYKITQLDMKSDSKLDFGGTDNKTLNVPDSQTLFVFGAITNSGAGNVLSGTSGFDKSAGYNASYMVRRADYSGIGKKTQTNDYNLSQNDISSAYSGKVPRIVVSNTNMKNDSYTNIMKLGTNSLNISVELSGSSYDLLDSGFRGIGKLFDCSVNEKSVSDQYITSFNGNNAIVKLGMDLKVYADNNKNPNKAGTNLENCNLIEGYGLITQLNKLTKIEKVTLSGSVSMVQTDTDGSAAYYSDKPTGGLIGVSNVALTVENIKFNNFSVTGSLEAGGVVGKVTKKLTVSNCTADGISVYGGAQVGGVVGLINYSYANISGGDFAVGQILTMGSMDENNLNQVNETYAAGGIVGFSQYNAIEISGFDITSKNDTSYIGLNGKKTTLGHHAGGVIGSSTSTINISKCNVAVDVYGNNSGGIVGRQRIGNVTVSECGYGKADDSKNYIVEGYSDVGGLVAYCTTAADISDCSVINTAIVATPSAYYKWGINSGGVIGHSESTSYNNFKNILMQDCNVKAVSSAAQTKGSDSGVHIGGALGLVSAKCTQGINGYNVLFDNVNVEYDLANGSYVEAGNVIGTNNSKSFKIVGFSKQNSSNLTQDFGNGNVGTDSYIIMADFNGECKTSPNEKTSTFAVGDTVSPASPWVTVNPSVKVGEDILTSDGVKSGTAAQIIKSAANGTKVNGNIYNSKNIQTYAQDLKDNYIDKLSDVGSLTNSDISGLNALLIDDNSAVNITKLLTEYISVLTNKDMAGSDESNMIFELGSSVKSVSVQTYEYSAGKLSKTSGKNSLAYKNGYFSTVSGCYDNENGKTKFTLIDISYNDPTGGSESVFHLQIPVYVKRVLDYSFTSKILIGTDYNAEHYNSSIVFASFGEPVTAYLSYSYYRTADEWADAINGGDDLMWNFAKSVYINNDNDMADMPATGTKFTLVDRNNADKAYSKEIADFGTNGRIDFADFGSISGDTDTFEPVTLGELLLQYADVTASVDSDGTLVKCEKTEAECVATLNGSTAYFRQKNDSDSSNVQTYKVTVAGKNSTELDNEKRLIVSENYYLTITTPEQTDEKVIKDYIKADEKLSGDLPTNYLSSVSTPSTMILGNFIKQSVTVSPLSNELISNTNDYINAQITTDITVNQTLAGTYSEYVNSGKVNMYQAFKLSMRRYDSEHPSGASVDIQAGTVRITKSIGETSKTESYPLQSAADYLYIPYGSSIMGQLMSANSLQITADVTLSYDQTSIISQFPERPDGTTYGVALTAASNISYSESNLENSSITSTSDETKSRFYREEMTAASLTYNVPKMITGQPKDAPYSQLGVNPSDESTQQYVVQAVGSYDVHEIASRTEADEIRFTLELQQKDKNGTYQTVNIDDYLKGITLLDSNDNEVSLANGYYSVNCTGSDSYDVTTKFTIKTGNEFENNGQLYSNYKVILQADLYKNGVQLTGSHASDYIVYTNARIYTDFVS